VPILRAEIRRGWRLFGRRGGLCHLADSQSISSDLRTFADLHARSWASIGKSRLLTLGERLSEFLGDVAGPLLGLQSGAFACCWRSAANRSTPGCALPRDHSYKNQFVNATDAVTWEMLLPVGGPARPHTAARAPRNYELEAHETTKRVRPDDQWLRLGKLCAAAPRRLTNLN